MRGPPPASSQVAPPRRPRPRRDGPTPSPSATTAPTGERSAEPSASADEEATRASQRRYPHPVERQGIIVTIAATAAAVGMGALAGLGKGEELLVLLVAGTAVVASLVRPAVAVHVALV